MTGHADTRVCLCGLDEGIRNETASEHDDGGRGPMFVAKLGRLETTADSVCLASDQSSASD